MKTALLFYDNRKDFIMNFSWSKPWESCKSWFKSKNKSVYSSPLPKTLYSKRVWICFGICLCLLFGLYVAWMLMVPMVKAPDEKVRIILSDYVFYNHHLPNAWDESVRIGIWGFSYALRPMLANILGAFNMWIVSWFTQDPLALFYGARIVSCFSGVAMVYFMFRTCEWLDWKPAWAFLTAFVCGLMPQIAFLASYSNNDLFCMAGVSAVLYCWIRGMRQDWSWSICIKFACAMGITILSYYNSYPYILMSIPVFFFSAFHRHMSKEEKIEVWKKAGVIFIITFLLAGWWFIRNGILYDGDLLGTKTRLIMGEQFGDPGYTPSTVFKAQREGVGFFEIWNYTHGYAFSWSKMTFMSSVALLGVMDFLFPAEAYDYPALFLVIGLAAFALQTLVWAARMIVDKVRKLPKHHPTSQNLFFFIVALLCAVMVILLSMYYSWTDDYQPQGRYIMPAFSTIILMMIAGFRFIVVDISLLFGKKHHSTAYSVLSWLVAIPLCAAMIGFQGYAYWRVSPSYLNDYTRMQQSYLEFKEKFYPGSTQGLMEKQGQELAQKGASSAPSSTKDPDS